MKQLTLFAFICGLLLSSAIAQEASNESTETQTVAGSENKPTQATETTANTSTDSTSAEESPKRNITPPISLIEQYKSDIERSVSKELLNPMLAGTEDFLTITQPDSHQADRGVAILLPEWGQAATDPKAVNFLRQYLPTQGWTTIAIQPPLKPQAYPVQAERLEESHQANQKLLETYQAKLSTMMVTVMEKAAEYPGIFVVIAQGNNAAMLIDLYQQEKVTKPNALVLLSSYLLTETDNKALALKIAQSEIPTLDLTLKKDVHWVKHFAALRKMSAKQNMKTYYRHRELTNFHAGYYPSDALAKEITGWITSIGW